MASTRGGLVHHWKHGWIPKDHHAALQKAHGSQSGAARIMSRHGISDGPKSLHSVDRSNGGKGKPAASDVRSTHPIGATVKASQPGIDNQTNGRIVGHTATGMVQVAHTGRNGKSLVGTFNPSHTQVVSPGTPAAAAVRTPHPAPHTLKPGELATVRGTDEYGQPTTFTGKVTANGAVASFSKGRTTGGQPLRSISIERQDGSKRQNVVYVPDPDRGEAKRGPAAERAGNPLGKDYRSMTPAEKVRAAEIMHGTGSSQHAKASAQHAARAAELRAAADKKRAEAARISDSVGAPDRAGAMLRAKDSQRMNARMDSGLRRSVEATNAAKALESKAHLAEGRAKSAADKQRAGDLNLKPADVTPGDMVSYKGRLQIVTKVNKTTVNVPSGYSWDDKVPLSSVTRHVRLSTQSDSAVKAAYDKTDSPKVKAALLVELKRRGLAT